MKDLTVDDINALIQDWQQGDCVLGNRNFFYGYTPTLPLTVSFAESVLGEDIVIVNEEVAGLVVVSQTCDIVRNCEDKPYIEISPLCEAPAGKWGQIKKHQMSGYALIPYLADKNIVADLDRTMTVEKSVLANWHSKKIRGCRSSEESMLFAWALARKRSRFAFPDIFVKTCNKFLQRIRDKHGKNTDEGKMLTEFKEIRVRSAPDWIGTNSTITFYFLLDKEKSLFTDWTKQIDEWKRLVQIANTPFSEVEMFVVDYDEITAREYKESMVLDLDGLSANDN